jgi:hypothetical protein
MKNFYMVPIVIFLGVSVWAAANPDYREIRLTATELASMSTTGPEAGTSGVSGIRTVILSGDPSELGLYTIRLTVPANVRIAGAFASR